MPCSRKPANNQRVTVRPATPKLLPIWVAENLQTTSASLCGRGCLGWCRHWTLSTVGHDATLPEEIARRHITSTATAACSPIAVVAIEFNHLHLSRRAVQVKCRLLGHSGNCRASCHAHEEGKA